MDALLERESAGVRVELHWSWQRGCEIEVTVGETSRSTSVADAEAMDAFWHPCVYLSPEHVAELFSLRPEPRGVVIDLSDADPDYPYEEVEL